MLDALTLSPRANPGKHLHFAVGEWLADRADVVTFFARGDARCICPLARPQAQGANFSALMVLRI